jgi:hypothetical protein
VKGGTETGAAAAGDDGSGGIIAGVDVGVTVRLACDCIGSGDEGVGTDGQGARGVGRSGGRVAGRGGGVILGRIGAVGVLGAG